MADEEIIEIGSDGTFEVPWTASQAKLPESEGANESITQLRDATDEEQSAIKTDSQEPEDTPTPLKIVTPAEIVDLEHEGSSYDTPTERDYSLSPSLSDDLASKEASVQENVATQEKHQHKENDLSREIQGEEHDSSGVGGDGASKEEDDVFEDAYEDESFIGRVKDRAKAKEIKEKGNEFFLQKEWQDAAECYTLAYEWCPEDDVEDRAVYMCNRAACHLNLGEMEQVVQDCTAALGGKPEYVKALMRRAQAYEHLEKYDLAIADVKEVLRLEPGMKIAQTSLTRLEKLHAENLEKMKEEAMEKLKDLGNSMLGYFGMSLDNFKVNQSEEGGGYNISFNK